MRRHGRPSHAVLALVLSCMLLATVPASDTDVPHVLVFSATYGYRHASITTGNQTIQQLADETDEFTVAFSESITDLSTEKLRNVDVLLFNSTTGRFPLTTEQRDGLERFWGCGGGFVGVHAAADANYGWPAYAELIGAQFDSHPHGSGAGEARLLVENGDHPVNAAYEGTAEWSHADEYYRWIRDLRGTQDVVALLSLDETTVAEGVQDGETPYPHHQPLSWTKTFRGQGRVYYTNLGHNEATWERAEFRTSLVEGLNWVSQVRLDLDCFDSDEPLPPPPAAPTPDPTAPREACAVEDGEERLTPEGVSRPVSFARPAPLYFGKAVTTFVVDLSSHAHAAAEVMFELEWDVPSDDYDLTVATPWGAFGGSDLAQPANPPVETTTVAGVLHCARLIVAVFNYAATTVPAPTLTASLVASGDDGGDPASAVPGTTAAITAPPNGVTVGFAPTAAVITEGGSLGFVNADTVSHNVACVDRDEETGRPLCQSAFVSLGETTSVDGVADLAPGSYAFLCQLHPQMTGELIVLDSP